MTPEEIADICDIPVELNTIKESLSKIPDTALALDILTSLEKVDQQLSKQNSIADKAKEEAERLRKANNSLMIRATAYNSTPPPNSNVNYTGVDPIQDIIDKV